MAAIIVGNPIKGALGIIPNAGAPSTGTNAVHTITIGGTPTAGSFTLSFDGYTSGAITWSATNATLISNIDAAVEAMPNIGTGGVVTAEGTITNGIGTITLTSGGNLAKLAHNAFTVTSSLTGTSPTLAISNGTPGVTATARGCGVGTIVNDITNGKLYENTGTSLIPVWTVTGAQS